MIGWEIRWRSVCRLEHRSRLYNTGTETYTNTTLLFYLDVDVVTIV